MELKELLARWVAGKEEDLARVKKEAAEILEKLGPDYPVDEDELDREGWAYLDELDNTEIVDHFSLVDDVRMIGLGIKLS